VDTAARYFDQLVSRVDYPMFIVTTAGYGERAGCLVGFLTQASIDPQRLLVLLSTKNATFRLAQQTTTFVVHFLSEDNVRLATLFGEQSGDWTDKFDDCDWSPGPDEVPVLAGVRGWVSGRVLDRFGAGDHVAHLLEVGNVGIDTEGPPLTFQVVRDMKPGHDA
jgi:flavin reductase (DIM6/NTAB) family NADH-FMN oxidoreductase RutF